MGRKTPAPGGSGAPPSRDGGTDPKENAPIRVIWPWRMPRRTGYQAGRDREATHYPQRITEEHSNHEQRRPYPDP